MAYAYGFVYQKVVDIDDEFEKGDLCWLETPLNPTGEARNIQFYADKVR